MDACKDRLRLRGHFLFKAYEWSDAVRLLGDEERAYKVEEEQVQLDTLIHSKPERPVWLYPEPMIQPLCQPFRKQLIVAMRKRLTSRSVGHFLRDQAIREEICSCSATERFSGTTTERPL